MSLREIIVDAGHVRSLSVPAGYVAGLSASVGGIVRDDKVVDIYVSAGSSGDGSPGQPFPIACQGDLDHIGADVNYYDDCFVMTADIYCRADVSYGDCVIAPGRSVGFKGVFDGDGHRIFNLRIDLVEQSTYTVGLFGYIASGGEIRNVGIENGRVTVSENRYTDMVGIICGLNRGIINRCYVTGFIKTSEISDSVGGICGEGGGIRDCYSLAYVDGYARWVGGLTGQSSRINSSYCASPIIVGPSDVGGLYGNDDGGEAGDDCFWDVEISDVNDGYGGVGLSTAEMEDVNTFISAGWDFYDGSGSALDEAWYMPTEGYPVLSWQGEFSGVSLVPNVYGFGEADAEQILSEAGFVVNVVYDYHRSVADGNVICRRPWNAVAGGEVDIVVSLGEYDWSWNEGDGGEGNPWEIDSGGQIDSLSIHPELFGDDFIVTNDIDMLGYGYNAAVISPDISGSYGYQGTAFSGVFDGQDFEKHRRR